MTCHPRRFPAVAAGALLACAVVVAPPHAAAQTPCQALGGTVETDTAPAPITTVALAPDSAAPTPAAPAPVTTAAPAPVTTAAPAPVTVGTDAGTCRVDVVTDRYEFRAAYPTDYPDEAALTSYLTQTRDGFVNVAGMPGSVSTTPYELDAAATSYRSGTAPGGTVGVVFEVYQDVGAAHPLTWFKAFSWDVDADAPLAVDRLWAPGVDAMPALYAAVQREAGRRLGRPVDIPPAVGLDPATYADFAVTDDALVVFFGQGELLAPAAGALSLPIPRADLPPLAI